MLASKIDSMITESCDILLTVQINIIGAEAMTKNRKSKTIDAATKAELLQAAFDLLLRAGEIDLAAWAVEKMPVRMHKAAYLEIKNAAIDSWRTRDAKAAKAPRAKAGKPRTASHEMRAH
jgi:hypothetical protein